MDVERALCSKIISTGQYANVAKDITPDMFGDDDCREMFEYIASHAREYGSCPSIEAAKEAMPDFEFEHIQDTIKYVIDRFKVLVRKRAAQDLVIELADAVDDPDKVAEIELHFLEAARELANLIPTESVARFSDMPDRIAEYRQQKKDGVKLGIPFGIPTLDEWTGGIQSHEFVTAAAFSGVGKSTLLRAIEFNIYSMPQDIVILHISLEETRQAILRKLDAMVGGVSYQKLKLLGLETAEIDRWMKKAEAVKKKASSKEIIILDTIRGCTPDKIFAETVRHKPDIVFIDYLSLMQSSHPSRSSSMWQSLTEITKDLKQNARVLSIPIIAAAQTNRSGAKDGAELENIGYALSVVQDADIVLGLHADEQMKIDKEMELRVKKNREGRLGKIKLQWDHEGNDGPIFGEKTPKDRFGRSSARVVPTAVPSGTSGRSRPTRAKSLGTAKRPRPLRAKKRPRRGD